MRFEIYCLQEIISFVLKLGQNTLPVSPCSNCYPKSQTMINIMNSYLQLPIIQRNASDPHIGVRPIFFSLAPVTSDSLNVTPPALQPATIICLHSLWLTCRSTQKAMQGAIIFGIEDYNYLQVQCGAYHHGYHPMLKHMFEWSLTLLLCKLKEFDTFQMLKWFSFLLGVPCVIFAHMINIDVWLSILQWATKVVETLLGNDAFRYFSICSILFASSVNSLIPPAPQFNVV